MNKSKQLLCKLFVLLLCLINMGVYGQKQSKTYKETFTVADDALLDVNTSHADIEFETWASDQVVIEAIIEIEGATAEEAQDYFKDSGFDILGNSSKVSIQTQAKNSWLYSNFLNDTQNFNIEMPRFPDISSFEFDFEFDELLDMPPLPINSMIEFDHEAFERDGEKYLKKWQKEFSKGYDKEHLEKLEEWAEKMERRQEKLEEKREKVLQKRLEAREERAEAYAERRERLENARAQRMEEHQERRKRFLVQRNFRKNKDKDSTHVIIMNGDSTRTYFHGGPNIFYSSSKGESKNYKVKKTIKVKMPKGMRIKMDVRHGEIKLAENTKNLKAILSHSSLWASTIDGDQTTISASYSPINVQNWNYGQLQAKYSEKIALKEVLNLKLNASSSDVTIDRLIHTAFIKNDFGPLRINKVDKAFKEIDISLQNAELTCETPEVPFTIYVNGTSSSFSCPNSITLEQTKNGSTIVNKGYLKTNSSDKSIVIHSKYSEVILE